jgi:hypothetical protein
MAPPLIEITHPCFSGGQATCQLLGTTVRFQDEDGWDTAELEDLPEEVQEILSAPVEQGDSYSMEDLNSAFDDEFDLSP